MYLIFFQLYFKFCYSSLGCLAELFIQSEKQFSMTNSLISSVIIKFKCNETVGFTDTVIHIFHYAKK